MELTAQDRVLAPLPLFHINPLGYGIVGALTAGADALTVAKFSASRFWPAVREHGITAMALHAPPVEILKRDTAEDAAGHRVRSCSTPTATSWPGSASRSRCPATAHRGGRRQPPAPVAARVEIPADASRYGAPPAATSRTGSTTTGRSTSASACPARCSPGTSPTASSTPPATATAGSPPATSAAATRPGDLTFLERAAESIRVKGEFVPIPFVEERLGTIPELVDLALWKKPGELVDDDVVLYAVADELPSSRSAPWPRSCPRSCGSHVARSAPSPATPRPGCSRLLHGQEVLSWTTL